MEYFGLLRAGTFLAVLIALSSAQDIRQSPEDVVVLSGASVEFICDTDAGAPIGADGVFRSLLWSRDIGNGKETIAMFSDGRKYSELEDADRYVLTDRTILSISDVTLQDGGQYTCEIQPTNEAAAAALVVVVPPEAQAPAEMTSGGSADEFSCLAEYKGPPVGLPAETTPLLEAYIDGVLQDQEATSSADASGQVTLDLSFELSIEEGTSQEFKELSCHLKTKNPSFTSEKTATTMITVPPHSMVITPVKEEYKIGEVITCAAQGIPEPTIKWMPMLSDQPRTISSPTLEITAGMVGDNEWICYADNTIQGLPERAEELFQFLVGAQTVEPETDSPVVQPHVANSNTTTIIIAVVAVVAVLLIIIIIAVVCIRRKRTSSSNYEAGKAERKLVEDSSKNQSNGKDYGKINTNADEEVPDVKIDSNGTNGSTPTEKVNGTNTAV